MEIERVDLGVCDGYFYAGDPDRCAAVLPGAMLGGMPVNAFVIAALVADGWSVVQVWDEYGGDFDSEPERLGWAHTRAEAAIAAAPNGNVRLISGKSLTSLTTGLAAERRLAAIWLTPLLHDETCVAGLRRKNAPALLIGGTEDEVWDGPLARELADEVSSLRAATTVSLGSRTSLVCRKPSRPSPPGSRGLMWIGVLAGMVQTKQVARVGRRA